MSLKRIYRLLQLTSLLQSGRGHNAPQLADLCEVSRRTIFRDLRALQESGIPVQYDADRQAYFVPSSFFLPPTNFSLDEALALLVVCHEAGEHQGLPFYKAARAAALKLQGNLPGNFRERFNRLAGSVQVRFPPSNPLADNEPIYRQLLDTLATRRQVRITYQSLTEWETIQTKLSPYHVFFSLRSWYVVGRSSLHRAVRTFNVGRIRKLDVLEDTYRIPPRFSLDRYLGNAWHLIREPGRRYRVTIRFQKMVAQNVAEVRWHKTQQVKWHRDGSIDFSVTVDGLNEISWWVLGYGDQAEVLRPAPLRDLVRQRVLRTAVLYEPRAESRGRRATSKKRSVANRKKR